MHISYQNDNINFWSFFTWLSYLTPCLALRQLLKWNNSGKNSRINHLWVYSFKIEKMQSKNGRGWKICVFIWDFISNVLPFLFKIKRLFFYRELVAVISNFIGWGILKIMSTNTSVTDRQNVVIYCFDLLTSKSSQ